MVSTRIDRETLSSPSDSSSDDMLERMLKEAEELALKMSRQCDSNASSRAGSVVSTDCANSNEQAMLATADEDEDGNMISGTLDDHRDGNGDLDAILRKSERLLGKMRSRSTNNAGAHSFNGAPSPSEVSPPKASPAAPTSVYLIDSSNGIDDVSSVGSASLRSAVPSPALRMPYFATTPEGRPIREDEPLVPSPPRPFLLSPDSINNSDRNEGLRYRYSGGASPSLQKRIPIVHPTPPRPTPPHGFAQDGDGPALSATPSSIAVAGTVIPDFSLPTPDAKWEKVHSANQGDDDYVPLVDYSKLPQSPIRTSNAGGSNRSKSSVDSSRSVDEKPRMGLRTGFDHALLPATASRVAAFRASKKRTRKRQRQIKAAAISVTCVLAAAYYCYCYRGADQSTVPGNSGDSLLPEAASSETNALPLEKTYNIQHEGGVDGDPLHSFANSTGGVASFHDEDGVDECIVHELPATEVEVGDGEEELDGWGFEREADKNNGFYSDWPGDTIPEADSLVGSITDAKGLAENESDIGGLAETVIGTPAVQPEDGAAPMFSDSDSALERKCKNLFQRVFNRKCRIRARQKKRTKVIHFLNLQAIAFL